MLIGKTGNYLTRAGGQVRLDYVGNLHCLGYVVGSGSPAVWATRDGQYWEADGTLRHAKRRNEEGAKEDGLDLIAWDQDQENPFAD